MAEQSMFRLDGRSALVTGAGRGIGRSIALALAEAGASVTCVDLDPRTAEQTAEAVTDQGVEAIAHRADLTDEQQVAPMIEAHVARFGRLDVLVNNAGVADHDPAEELSAKHWDFIFNLNLRGLFFVAQAGGRVMLDQGAGAIVNLASMSGLIVNTPQPQAAYNASKAGVIMLTKSLAAEWADRGVRVNAVSPGYTATEMIMMDDVRPMHDGWTQRIPMGRFAKTEEIAASVLFLATDAASYITGHNLVVDGGYTLW